MFRLRLARNVLPTMDNLRKFGDSVETECIFCGRKDEIVLHLFHRFQVARAPLFALCGILADAWVFLTPLHILNLAQQLLF